MRQQAKFKDASHSVVLSWLGKIYGIDPSEYERVDDLLGCDEIAFARGHRFPEGLKQAIFIPERFPVRQAMWKLTKGSKLVKWVKDVMTENENEQQEYFLLLVDSSLSGPDSLLLFHALVYDEDESIDFDDMRAWDTPEHGPVPNQISGGCVITWNKKPWYMAAEAMQLTTYKENDSNS